MDQFRRIGSIVGLLLIMLVGTGASTMAQEAGQPQLLLTRVDADAFPEVRVFARGANLGVGWDELPISIEENNKAVEGFDKEVATVGTQTALLLDASGSILDPGQTGQIRKDEVANVVSLLTEQGVLQPEYDWLAAYGTQLDGSIAPIQDWTRDHVAVSNQLYLYQPPNNPDLETPLYDLIFFALDRMEIEDVADNFAKSIVLFSDGLSGSSNLELDDAVNRAAERNIKIHAILLGAPTEEGTRNMRRVATLTGGQYVELSSEAALNGLWESVAGDRDQLVISYRSPNADPREVRVSATLPNGSTVRAARAFPALDVEAVTISIREPADGFEIERTAPEWDTPLSAVKPDQLIAEVTFDWPDGQERELATVEYVIGNDTIIREEPPFDRARIPIADLDTGRHTLRVIATDELGVRGESAPRVITVTVSRPPQPAAGGATITIPGTSITIPQSQVTLWGSLLALALGVTALIIALRKPTVRERVVNVVEGAVKAVTEPFMFNRQQAFKGSDIVAKLIVEDRGRALNLPAIVDIRGGTTRFGRAPEYANVVIDDPRVSRYHCRIAENPDKELVLYDEGGSSGTFVNFEPVAMEGQVLQSDDIINVGPIQFIFKYKSDLPEGPSADGHIDWDSKEATEPFSPYNPDM